MKRSWRGQITTGILLSLLLGWTPEVKAQAATASYRVEYGPAHLADLELSLGCSDDGEVSARLFAESQGLAKRVHPFRVRLDSLRNAGVAVHRAQTWIEERGEARRYRSQFEWAPRVATSALFQGRESREVVTLPTAGEDLLSWMLDLRGEVARSGVQEGARRYSIWDGWKLVWLSVVPGKVETREVAGELVQAQSFRLLRTRVDHEDEGEFRPLQATENLGTLWIEVSERALPVAMAFRAPIGRVWIDLITFEPQGCDGVDDE